MRLIPEERKLMTKSINNGNSINVVAKVFGVSRTTAWYWKDETTNFEDLPRNNRSKITVEVEIAILFLRLTFEWGTARIQQGLMNLPDFQLKEMEVYIQNFHLSRTSINNILKKHKINGYQNKIAISTSTVILLLLFRGKSSKFVVSSFQYHAVVLLTPNTLATTFIELPLFIDLVMSFRSSGINLMSMGRATCLIFIYLVSLSKHLFRDIL